LGPQPPPVGPWFRKLLQLAAILVCPHPPTILLEQRHMKMELKWKVGPTSQLLNEHACLRIFLERHEEVDR
jgi:hypothetical protein